MFRNAGLIYVSDNCLFQKGGLPWKIMYDGQNLTEYEVASCDLAKFIRGRKEVHAESLAGFSNGVYGGYAIGV